MNEPLPLPSAHTQPNNPAPSDSAQPATTHVVSPTPATNVIAMPSSEPHYGRFAVQCLHAKGGLGEVHVAVDEELRRKVALKRMQERCAHDPAARRRFLNEAEITARLEHPGIVPIYGLVQDEHGQPCYAMRFIAGQSLSEAIREFHRTTGGVNQRFNSVTFRSLLQRFISVCQTLAYAHSQRVIHRDLKPANIMLGPFGETLVVDWGLARELVSQDRQRSEDGPEERALPTTIHCVPSGTDDVLATQAGQALGTLGYIAPEQAAGRWSAVGACSDIYSLGATLYEMLTGQRPIRGSDQSEALQRAQAGEFPGPCQVTHDVPKPLEAITLKAMARQPVDRYTAASDLSAELEHWLADEPVSAYVEPWTTRAGRWARKHRAIMAASGAVLLTASLGLAVGLFFVNEEKNRSDRAREGETHQRLIAEASEEHAKTEAATAHAIESFLRYDLLQLASPHEQQQQQATGVRMDPELKVQELVLRAAQKIDGKFPSQPLVEAELRSTLGWTLNDMGRADLAVPQFLRVRELYTTQLGPEDPNTLQSIASLAVSYTALGRPAEALKLREEVLQLRKAKLGLDHRDTLQTMASLANSYDAVGRHTDAIRLYEETLKRQLATLGPDDPETLRSTSNLAIIYAGVGRHDDALKLREETLRRRQVKLGPDHPDTLRSMLGLAVSYAMAGRHVEAIKLGEETLNLQRAKLGPDHPDTLHTMNNLANSYAALAQHPKAIQLREETLRLRQDKLGRDHPDTLATMTNLAGSYTAVGRHEEALKLKEATFELQKAKLGPEHRHTLYTMSNLANSYAALGRHEEALKLREEVLRIQKKRAGPDHPDTLQGMALLAKSYAYFGRNAEALALREQTLQIRTTKLGPNHPDTLASMADRAESLVQLNRGPEGIALIDDCVRRATGNTVNRRLLADVLDLRLRYFAKAKDAASCRATAEMWERLQRSDAGSLYMATCLRAVTAAIVKLDPQTPATEAAQLAREEADKAMAWLKQAVAVGYKDVEHMKKDADLDALRQREDFQKLVKDLETVKPGTDP